MDIHRLFLFLAAFCFFVSCSYPAFAIDDSEEGAHLDTLLKMSLEELIEVEVTVATGTPKTLKQAPSVATVITAGDIERMGARTLEEVLETIPGIHVSPSASYYLMPVWSIRGIQTRLNPYVLLLINGVPLTDPSSSSPAAGYNYRMMTSMIEKIEIIRGPGSAVHGAEAMAGIVNVITKEGKDINGTRMGGSAGSFDTYRAYSQHGGKYSGWDVAAGIEYQKSQGDDNRIIEQDFLGSGPPSLTPAPVDTWYEVVDAHLGIHKDNWQFRFYGYLQDSHLGAGGLQAVTYGNDIDTKNMLAELKYTNKDLLDNSELSLRLWGNYQDVDVFFQFFPTAFRNMLGNPMYTNKIGGLDGTLLHSFSDNNSLRLGMGIDYLDEDIDQEKNFGAGVPVQFGPLVNIADTPYVYRDDKNRNHWYTLAQDEWAFMPQWELTLGVRYDDYSDFGDTINPRIALVWEILDTLTTKLLYGSAFHTPSMGQLYNKNNPQSLGNSNLDPETSDTYELVFDYVPTHKLMTRLNLFYYEIDDQVEYVQDPAPATTKTAQNYRNQEGYGFEVEADWLVTDTLRVNADIAYQRSKDGDTDELVPYAPQLQLHINPIWTFLPDWTLDTQFFWIADRPRAAGDTRDEIDDYELVNLTLTKNNILENLDLALAVRNLFDEDVREPSDGTLPNDHPMEERSFWAELRYQF